MGKRFRNRNRMHLERCSSLMKILPRIQINTKTKDAHRNLMEYPVEN